jgi:dimethylargininase
MRRALTRAIPSTYRQATSSFFGGENVVLSKAMAQHNAYVSNLRAAGCVVDVLPAVDDFPDSPFVEDTAVIIGGRALITRSAHPVRRGEAPAVASYLHASGLELVQMDAPATLDGGDVLVVGDRVFVGLSARTNLAGIDALGQFVGPRLQVIDLPSSVLHLKCVCSTPSPNTVLLAAGTIGATAFQGLEVLLIPQEEAYAANVVGVNSSVLISRGYPSTQHVLESHGLKVVTLETSMFKAMDGSLTCLSLLW